MRARARAAGSVAWGKAQILLASVLWGTTGTSQALAPDGVRPVAVAAVRVVLGGAALVAWAAGRRLLRPMRPLPVALASLSLVVAQVTFFAALVRTGVAVGTVVAIGSAPIFAGALERVVRGVRPGRRWVLATALAIAGCVLLLAPGKGAEVDPLGVLLALLPGLGYAGYTLATKNLLDEHAPESVTAAVFGVGALALLPLLFLVDLAWTTEPRGAAIALHLGLVTVACAYIAFSRGLTVVPAATAVTLTLAEPVTAATLGMVVLDERLAPVSFAGAALVLAGLALLTLPDGSTGRRPSTASWSRGRRGTGRGRS